VRQSTKIEGIKTIWSSPEPKEKTGPGQKLSIKENGEVVLIDANKQTVWSSEYRGTKNGEAKLVIGNDGLAVASLNEKQIWNHKMPEKNKPDPKPDPKPVPKPDDNSPPNPPKPVNLKILQSGDSLAIDQRLVSSDEKCWLSLNSKGDFGVSTAKGFLWKAQINTLNNADAPVSAVLKKTGELVLLAEDKETEVWSSESGDNNTKVAQLKMNNNGHAEIFAGDQRLWYSDRLKDMAANTNEDRLVAGEWLQPEQALVLGNLSLLLQKTGELVLLQDNIKMWHEQAATTSVTNATRVTLQPDDNLSVGLLNKPPTWTSKSRRRKNAGNAVLRIIDSREGGPAAIIESDSDGSITLWSTKKPYIPTWEYLKVCFEPHSDFRHR
jgi:hypothetical protein